MVLGQSYTSGGTYTGTFTGTIHSQAVTGTFSGTDSVSSALFRHQTVHERAGTFDAIKGDYVLNASGKMTLKSGSQSITVNFTLVESNTFWAAPGVGVVREISDDSLGLTFPDHTT